MLKISRNDVSRYKKVITATCLIVLIQLVVGASSIYFISLAQVKNYIRRIANEAKQDIVYKNGRWDTSRYDTNPEIPGNFRLYVITEDGYVIDRWRPIKGYLDTSDFKQLLTYQNPQTVKTVTGQSWRILTIPIKASGQDTVGVVTVGYYKLEGNRDEEIDTRLNIAARSLLDKVTVSKSDINASEVNARDVPYDISFQIVDQYNAIHAKSDTANSIDRLPNYIDPSYVSRQLKEPTLRLVEDKSSEIFMVQSIPLYNNDSPLGTIIVARTISPYISLIRWYILLMSIFDTVVITVIGTYLIKQSKRFEQKRNSYVAAASRLSPDDVESISFNKNDCVIRINSLEVPVTYASNQYYMCLALFNAPKKKWETDELLDKFGESDHREGWRKIYDAMTSLNRKVGKLADFKLFTTSNKTYQINPDFAGKVSNKKQ